MSGGTTNVVVSWQSPSSSVTNYSIVRTSGTNVTTYTVSGNVSSWTDTKAPAGSTYQVAANYPSGSAGSSPTADPTYNPLLAIDPEIVRGPAPSSSSLTPLQIVLGGIVPTNVTAIRVHKKVSPLVYNYQNGAYDWWLVWYAGDQGWYAYFPDSIADGSFDVPIGSFTNGIYQIPVSQLSEWCAYYFQLQPIGSDGRGGVINAPVFARNVPFVDGSAVLKDNLSFILRAGETGDPNAYDPALVDFEANNNYAAVSPYVQHMDISPDWVTEVAAFNDNWFMRNWEYDGDFDYFFDSDNGNTYYFFWWNKHLDPYGGYSAGYTKYQFDGFTYVNTQSASLLNSQLTNNPPIYLGFDIPNEIGFFGSPPDQSGLFWDGSQTELASGWENYFGLTYQSVRVTQSQNPLGVQHDISAGGSYADPMPDDYSEYFQKVSAPSLTTVDYYFAESGDPTSEEAATLTPMPNDPNFSVTNTTSLIIAGVGQPAAIYGWAKQQISNGDSSKFAYLGQYFDKAYKTDGSGNATSTQTGILSEYGDFFATEPGKVILKTKADPGQGGSQGQCPVYAVSLNVDANHNGVMDLTYSGQDTTSANQPMVFWANNDRDDVGTGGNPDRDVWLSPTATNTDYSFGQIRTMRNLEDFSRLWICGMPTLPASQGYSVQIGWSQIESGAPRLRLYRASETNGGIGYLTNITIASQQILDYNSPIGEVTPTSSLSLPTSWFTNGLSRYFLFEAGAVGKGALTLTILQGSNVIAQISAWMDFHDIRDFYEEVAITSVVQTWPEMVQTNLNSSFAVQSYPKADIGDAKQMAVFVHGWRMPYSDYQIFSQTMFKRLYWQGYQGKFATVRWPTRSAETELFAAMDYITYNRSEHIAFESATGVAAYFNKLRERFPDCTISACAHSMGGIVVTETLKILANAGQQPLDNLVLMQAAVPAHCFDPNATSYQMFLDGEAVAPTPDTYRNYASGITNALRPGGKIVNFFNTNDFALTIWRLNQAFYNANYLGNGVTTIKPNAFLGYFTDGTNSVLRTNVWNQGFLSTLYGGYYGNGPTRTITNLHELMPFVARPRSEAVGSLPGVHGQILGQEFDLQTQVGFTASSSDHSGQFNRNIQGPIWLFYSNLKTSLFNPQ